MIGVGLAVTGVLLLSRASGPSLLTQPWLLVALAIYALNLGARVLHPAPEPAAPAPARRPATTPTWRLRARRQRYVSYAMAALVGTIGVLMSTKPTLW